MKNYSGPCYSIDESLELLSCNLSELRYHLENGSINAVVYTKPRRFLLFTVQASDKQWIGHSVVTYRGHYSLHNSYVYKLMDGEKICIGTGYGRLLDVNGISSSANEYPFKWPCPHSKIEYWQPWDNDPEGFLRFPATPLPAEHEPGLKAFENLLVTVAEGLSDKDKGAELYERVYKGPDLVLNFNSNSEFFPEDLRIPASEIKQFLSSQAKKETEEKMALEYQKNRQENKRENQLHSLVSRVLAKYPDIKAKEAWRIIEKDSELDSPFFDVENIILGMDGDCIEWRSRQNVERSLSWKSFKPLVSKLRARI